MDETYLSNNNGQHARQRTPLRESVMKKRNEFADAKTPEQFIRALKRIKCPPVPLGGGNNSRSPFRRPQVVPAGTHNSNLMDDMLSLEQRKKSYMDRNRISGIRNERSNERSHHNDATNFQSGQSNNLAQNHHKYKSNLSKTNKGMKQYRFQIGI